MTGKLATRPAIVPAGLEEIEQRIIAARNAFVVSTVEIGAGLNDAYAILGDKEFWPWCNRLVGWSRRTVQQYRSVALVFASQPREVITQIDSKALYELSAAPAPIQQTTLERASNGERITVRDVRKQLKGAGDAKPKKARPKPPATAAGPAVAEGSPLRAVSKDAFGNPIPDELKEIFGGQGLYRATTILTLLTQAKRYLRELGLSDAGQYMATATIEKDLAAVRQGIEVAKPFCLCPACIGDNVPARCPCKGRGWLPRKLYERLPREQRIWGEVVAAKGTGDGSNN